jgi:DNA-binding transcriptional LysR family regulator
VVCELITFGYQVGVQLRHLRYFVAVAKELNFRRAAESLHVSQPALSKQIKDLEDAVGVQLLKRNTGGVMLTDAGMVLLEEAQDILERVDMAAAAARDAAAGRGGRLTVGNLGAISAGFLPAALAVFRTRYPQVEVTLQEMALPDQLTALKAGKIHVGFTIDPVESLAPEFAPTEVLQSHLALAMGREHALARKSRVALAEVAAEQFLCVGETERHDLHRRRIQEVFAARRIKHRPLRRVNSLESLIALVGGNHGLSIMLPTPRSSENITFRRIKEDGDDLKVRLLAVCRKGTESQLARNFVDALLHRART